MGPLRSGPKGGTDGVGQYKTLGTRDSIRAQRGRARSALFNRVYSIFVELLKQWSSSYNQFCNYRNYIDLNC